MKAKKKRLNWGQQILLALFFFLLGVGVNQRWHWPGRWLVKRPATATARADMTLFWQVWDLLEKNYLNPKALDKKKMVYGAIEGMVASLGDPYTVFLPPEENKLDQEDLGGEFGGVGIQLGFRDHHLTVIAPLKDTPAEKAGVRAGDIILHIKDRRKHLDVSTEGISLPQAVKWIRGPVGTAVTLTVQQPEESKPRVIKIVRGKIVVPTVVWKEADFGGRKIAYVRVYRFAEILPSQWAKFYQQEQEWQRDSRFAGIVLDLRDNPGGYLSGAVYLASEFLPRGVVVKQDNGHGRDKIYRVDHRGRLLQVPLVVLVNRGSASAAEILAGALQAHHRALLVGEQTFGKGTVQEPEALPGGAGLHITIARWLLPDGRSINKKGIKPDIEVKAETKEEAKGDLPKDPVFQKAAEILKVKSLSGIGTRN